MNIWSNLGYNPVKLFLRTLGQRRLEIRAPLRISSREKGEKNSLWNWSARLNHNESINKWEALHFSLSTYVLMETERNRDREEGGERTGRGRRRWPGATTRLVKVRPLTGSWILSTRLFQSLTLLLSIWSLFEGGGCLEVVGWRRVTGDRWSSGADIDIGSRSCRAEPGIQSSRCGGGGNLLQAWCGAHLETAADRQSSKRWPIKDWKSLERQVLGWGGAD